ncbi:hypothetical protein H6F67_15670 [Microcoleus sp. FACHB-1515]|uniref:hypothetical protein n=1 Tax=Cyanophyceae TaxID=3028117 RepID=UPI0016895E62|nr:hypothetical protein [Microcoleus sp. FACHB-1515]MBD2091293.1 hypothetical protein [Microcoleus sp. FACHB-1515]
MHETTRRLLFLLLFAIVFFQTGAHVSQAFVNYPAWQYIGSESFTDYHRVMTSGALRVLLLPRIIELALAMLVLCFPPRIIKRWLLVLAIAFALCAFLSTVLIQLPIHRQLGTVGNTPELLTQLRTTDWVRQIAELVRAALYFWMIGATLVESSTGARYYSAGRPRSPRWELVRPR